MAAHIEQFGIAWGAGAVSAQRAQEMAAIGVRWCRFEIEWTNIEPTTKGQFTGWASYDDSVAACEAAGIRVLGLLTTTPTWARQGGLPDFPSEAPWWTPPANAVNYADFCAAAVNRYKPGGTQGRNVRHWELWNEPNLSGFWGGYRPQPTQMAEMLMAAYPAIKQADKYAYVVSPGMAPVGDYNMDEGFRRNGLKFIEEMCERGATYSFDGLGWHPYDSGGYGFHVESAWSQMDATAVNLRSVLTAIGRPNVPIWATEHGTTSTWGITAAVEAARLTEGYQRWNDKPWPRGPLFHFTFRNATGDAPGFSLVDPTTGTQRPKYQAYRDADRYGPTLWPPLGIPEPPFQMAGITSALQIKSLLRDWDSRNPTVAERNAWFANARCPHGHTVTGLVVIAPDGQVFPFARCDAPPQEKKYFLVLWPPYFYPEL